MSNYTLGIDIGYSSVKIAILDNDNNLAFEYYKLHRGKIKEVLGSALDEIEKKLDVSEIVFGAITGSAARQMTGEGSVNRVNEASAAIEGAMFLNPLVQSVIEIGGQSTKYYTGFNACKNGVEGSRNALEMSSNSDCAAGTGSFLEEQASRLNIKIEDYAEYAGRARSVPRIAGRCSVFAKTDIIHHQQEGIPSEDILKGVAYAIVRNYRGSVIRRLPVNSPVLFIGGVAGNGAVTTALRDVLKKDDNELTVSSNSNTAGAIGAAVIARKENFKLLFGDVRKIVSFIGTGEEEVGEKENLVPLSSIEPEDISEKHRLSSNGIVPSGESCYLGIDIGSTSTNLVLINSRSEIVKFKYIRTQGNPLNAVKEGLAQIYYEMGGDMNISGVGITGSGRNLIGKEIGADVIKDEITAQARAAVKIDPKVDTIFEIGGQDSKYISISDGAVTDFQMNKVCAAGTGSFLDEQAEEFNIPVEELGALALKGENPVSLGERCTVFIKSGVAACLSRGEKIEDIVAGLCYSIVKNYLHKVVGHKKIGDRILLQGGIAFNKGVVNAFKLLTKKSITITPFFSVTGAYGASLIAQEETIGETTFIGLEKLKNISQGDTLAGNGIEEKGLGQFNKKMEDLIFHDYDKTMDSSRKTVGIPRALFTYGMFPMFNAIFRELGFNVLLSDWSNENTIRKGQEYAMEETCFPVKLIIGHVAELVEKGVDYIFFPDLYTIDHPGSASRQNYGCAYMQLAFKIVSHTMDLKNKGIKLVAPTFAFNLGKDFMKNSFSGIGKVLGRSEEETGDALKKGMEAFNKFEERMEENGKKAITNLDPDKITFVLISKIYGIADPILNLGIPDKLIGMGYQVLSFFDLPEGVDLSDEHPNMFWPFGQHILEPGYLVREIPNMYAVLLTHHCCGPDSVLTHYFREIMGSKPYLNIEIDEHASAVGVATRLEAFVNSLKPDLQAEKHEPEYYLKKIRYKKVNIDSQIEKKGNKLYIPDLQPYSEIFKEDLIKNGYNAMVLDTNEKTIMAGRKHVLTNEYFSLSSLLGGCFEVLEGVKNYGDVSFLIPQTEGAEVEGQYSRVLRTECDENDYAGVNIISPFLEDIICSGDDFLKTVFYSILASDIINAAPYSKRPEYLLWIKNLIRGNELDMPRLKIVAQTIYADQKKQNHGKTILAVGEPSIVYNRILNDNVFINLEKQNHKVFYAPLAEAIWMFWYDYVKLNKADSVETKAALDGLRNDMEQLSVQLKEQSPFTSVEELVKKADETIGYYSGAFARYRESKALCFGDKADGIITAASVYENSGISLNILHKGFLEGKAKPILNLTFDGSKNENDRSKVESFVYYL